MRISDWSSDVCSSDLTDDVVSDSFTYVVVDGDGDTASANLVINIKDGEPEATPATISATVEEEHLPGGNEDTAPGADQDTEFDFNQTTDGASGSLVHLEIGRAHV